MAKQFKPVTLYYHLSMYESMEKALNSIQEEGLMVEGFEIEKTEKNTVIKITIEQKESFLIQFGIRTGKLCDE